METLQPLSSAYAVPTGPDERENEFEVQAALFSALKANGFEVRGEVRWGQKRTAGQRRETCRFDLVIYKGGVAVRIVEVKWGAVKHKHGVENTRQGRRYRQFGVPVTFVYGGDDAFKFLQMMLSERGPLTSARQATGREG